MAKKKRLVGGECVTIPETSGSHGQREEGLVSGESAGEVARSPLWHRADEAVGGAWYYVAGNAA